MSVADYVDRTSDVLGFHGVVPGQTVPLEQTLLPAGTGGFLVTGVEKLAQQFLLVLLTEQGSKEYDAGYGCRFMAEARRGAWRTPADVRQAFAFSVVDVRRQIQAAYLADTPDDERYADARLTHVTLSLDSLAITVELTSVAGDSRKFIAPLPVVVK